MTRRPLLLAAVFGIAAIEGCAPPAPETTERIIRIQIEGCEDATPLPIAATPTPVAVMATPDLASTGGETPAAVVTAVAIQTRVPRTPLPVARTAEQLAEEVALERESFFATLADAKLHPLDVPEAMESLRRSDDFVRAKNYDEALRYADVAVRQAQSVKISEPFIEKKFKRVEARFEAARPSLKPGGIDTGQKALARAQQAFLSNNFRQANAVLYDVDVLLDRRNAKDATRAR